MNSKWVYEEIKDLIEKNKIELGIDSVGSEILLLSLMQLKDSMTSMLLKEFMVKEEDIKSYIKSTIFFRKNPYTSKFYEIINYATGLLDEEDYTYDEPYLLAIVKCQDNVAYDILKKYGITERIITEEVEHVSEYIKNENKVLVNLSKLAREDRLNTLVGRTEILDKMERILFKKQKNNPLLIGEAGVGKTGLVEGLAYRFIEKYPSITIYSLDISILMAGTRYRGDLEEKLIDVIDIIKGENSILFIDEIHNITSSNSSESSLDIASILKPILARSEIKCIGATTLEEYYKYIDKDKALSRRFVSIFVPEVSIDECINILEEIKYRYERYYHIKYPKNIISYLVHMSELITNRRYPDKAIDIMDEAGVYAKSLGKKQVSKNHVDKIVFEYLSLDKDSIIKKLEEINPSYKEEIHKYLNNQNKFYCLKLDSDDYKKDLEDLMNIFSIGIENVLVVDMDEYQDYSHVNNLIGAPSGYVGYENGGIITEHIYRHPFSIVVFNNYDHASIYFKGIIEKAMEKGYIIDSKRRYIYLKNTIFIFSKNKAIKTIGFKP